MITHRTRRTEKRRALTPSGVWCDVITCDWGVPLEARALVDDVEQAARAHTQSTGHATHVRFVEQDTFERIAVGRLGR